MGEITKWGEITKVARDSSWAEFSKVGRDVFGASRLQFLAISIAILLHYILIPIGPILMRKI